MSVSLRSFSFFVALLFTGLFGASSAQAQRAIPVNIQSTPPGAQVFLDSPETAALGVTPLTNKAIAPGAHTLIFRMNNYEETRLPIRVARRRETFTATLTPFATIAVRAGNDSANGASVRIDGQASGTVPTDIPVRAGRHLVQVGREGYVTANNWVDVTSGQLASMSITLEREAPQTGSAVVASDIAGAHVYVDGAERGTTPTVIDNLTAGPHVFELRAEGATSHSETVNIFAGQRATLNVTLRQAQVAAQGGSLRVLVTPRGAMVSVDGEALGEAPASKDDLAPGEHIIEATAEGYEPAQQTVTIESGRQRAVSIVMTPRALPPGRIVVNANIGAARVSVDGAEPRGVPVVVENASTGTHAIVVSAPGYDDYRSTCEVAPGRNCELNVELHSGGVRVRVTSNINGSQFFVDGQAIGPVPYEGALAPGAHRLEVRADGYQPYTEQVELTPQNEARVVSATLQPIHIGPTEQEVAVEEERRARDRFGAVSHAAGVLPPDLFVLDMSIGWPYLAEVRLGIGINDWFEAGVAIRSFGRLTDFEGRAKFSWRPIPQFAVGGLARLGGGIGPEGANSFFGGVDALTSLYFSNRGAFTLWLGFEGYTDAYRYQSTNYGVDLCANFAETGGMCTSLAGRDSAIRPHVGGSLEIVITEHWNVWGILEGMFYGPGRRIFGDFIINGEPDTEIYFRLGATYKF